MNSFDSLTIVFDKYTMPIKVKAVKSFITDELVRLSKETGYPIDSLKIDFYFDESAPVLAYFSHYTEEPIGFFFNLARCNGRSANQIIDVCRHEFAHYVVFARKIGYNSKNAHNAYWKKVCKEIGARPCAYASNEITRHIA